MAVDVEKLNFIPLPDAKYGNLMNSGNMDRFVASEVGQAQVKRLDREIRLQKDEDGKPYEPDIRMIRRAIGFEQASQSYDRKPDLTVEQLMKSDGPKWYESLGASLKDIFKSADQGISTAATFGAEAIVTGVTSNSGLTGQAATALGAAGSRR